jgi:hypothetical protein
VIHSAPVITEDLDVTPGPATRPNKEVYEGGEEWIGRGSQRNQEAVRAPKRPHRSRSAGSDVEGPDCRRNEA